MHRIALILLLSLLLLAPHHAAAQTDTPPPAPTSVVGEFTNAAQAFGVLNVVLAVIVIGVLVIVILGVRYVLMPLIQANTQANQSIVTMQAGMATSLSASNSVSERMLLTMKEMEDRKEAREARDVVAKAINTHTTEDNEKTRVEVRKIYDKLKEADETAGEVAATRADLEAVILPLRNDIQELLRRTDDAARKVVEVQAADSGMMSATDEAKGSQ